MGDKGRRLLRPPLQEPTAEVPGGPLEKAQAPLDTGQGQLEVVHLPVLVRGCEVVCAERAEQQSQEEVQDLWRQQIRLTKSGAMPWALSLRSTMRKLRHRALKGAKGKP